MSTRPNQPISPLSPDERLTLREVRIVADLRVMHSKVDELYQAVRSLQRHHSDTDIHAYADPPVLGDDISKVADIYVFFVKLKEERERRGSQ